ncbi:MAG: hypothetical protein JF606_06125 [Burkholderiales bacterium]|jgi:hypothetical protein|nr:hypothetical protein [Burkholderiales bacterium]
MKPLIFCKDLVKLLDVEHHAVATGLIECGVPRDDLTPPAAHQSDHNCFMVPRDAQEKKSGHLTLSAIRSATTRPSRRLCGWTK